jgi:hypothetical protein
MKQTFYTIECGVQVLLCTYRQNASVPPERWYPPYRMYGVTIQKITLLHEVRSEVLAAVCAQAVMLWVVTLCCLIGGYQLLG